LNYPIVIHKEDGSAFGVIVPDLSGCFSAGDTLDDAISQAKEAIECHLEGMLLDNEPIPQRTQSIEEHQKNPDYAGGIWAVVDVDISKLKAVSKRYNITIPERVMAIIDTAAKNEGESRSAFLAKAAIARVEHTLHP